jgi:2-iminobutanoate/2-iminopropanoate deaminase
MSKRPVQTDEAPKPLARYSQAIRVGNTLYVQGMIGLDPETGRLVEGGIKAETLRVFQSLRAILAADQLTMDHVVKVVAYLADLNEYIPFNAVYNAQFPNDPAPVRTTVQAALPLGARVEVEILACAK